MEKIATELPGVYILRPRVIGDHRGSFMETYSSAMFADLGLESSFGQDNQSYTARKGTLRGIHYQKNPLPQCKVVRVVRGALLDVAVDLRRGSPTYRKWVGVELSEENKCMLYIPHGFGHGFITLTDDVECCYKVDNLFGAELDRAVRFDDPEIGVDWGVKDPILSDRDRSAPLLRDSDCDFTYETERGI